MSHTSGKKEEEWGHSYMATLFYYDAVPLGWLPFLIPQMIQSCSFFSGT